MAKPNKLIAVDIFSSRLCVLILNSSWASSTYKGVRNPEFQEIGRIKASLLSAVNNCSHTMGFRGRSEKSGSHTFPSWWLTEGNSSPKFVLLLDVGGRDLSVRGFQRPNQSQGYSQQLIRTWN